MRARRQKDLICAEMVSHFQPQLRSHHSGPKVLGHDKTNLHRCENERDSRKSLRRNDIVLVQSGLADGGWSEPIDCSCCWKYLGFIGNRTNTVREKRFRAPLDGPIWPFWSRNSVQTHLSKRQGSSSPVWLNDVGWHSSKGMHHAYGRCMDRRLTHRRRGRS